MSTTDPVELLREIVAFSQVSRTAAAGHPLWARVFDAIDAGPVSDVDSMIEKLDARCAETGERWEVYRGVSVGDDPGPWIAQATDRHLGKRDDAAALSIRADTMSEALGGLLATPRLPVIPRQPESGVYLTVEKCDGWWEVRHNGVFAGYRARTKREATAAKEQGEARARAHYEEWVTNWAVIVDAGVEGVDFYWKS